jgi:hypothetical protein
MGKGSAQYYKYKPNPRLKAQILIKQEGRCAYCNVSLHAVKLNWDHFIPWSYLRNSGGNDNWIASCLLCNAKKSDKHFKTEEDLYAFCDSVVRNHGSLGNGWPEDSNMWQIQLGILANAPIRLNRSEKPFVDPDFAETEVFDLEK